MALPVLFKPATHLLLFSTSFGMSTFYSFVASIIAFKTLELEQFSKLQNQVFPVYFKIQTFTPVLLGLTSPVAMTNTALCTLSLASFTGLVNWLFILPRAKQIKVQRKQLDKNDSQYVVKDEQLKKRFAKIHGFSSLFNMTHIGTMLFYGVCLSSQLII
ncbi:hypothetical protein KAFR_0D04170 [Kazachstania africana CBS 2517]|uniref:TMEM205-like domain-containing protein n=1 Tax=Kazachstania africana (strain ATCC 22294 / BCRC 22015 / CBS 2517 / CECT 1963 / NBRC 1671 / NRRL Y-8276) TaxID=1071382 RepID=H2AUL5_KAZAF|nr:hypothetical protein KAFR_0D04170 [Kazachstania africana CBS 2517]CCF58065.1 hypothetical protein KAFR_0D04170 [Kazachstania africana CBS 2517]